jgi:WD40 repeat protein
MGNTFGAPAPAPPTARTSTGPFCRSQCSKSPGRLGMRVLDAMAVYTPSSSDDKSVIVPRVITTGPDGLHVTDSLSGKTLLTVAQGLPRFPVAYPLPDGSPRIGAYMTGSTQIQVWDGNSLRPVLEWAVGPATYVGPGLHAFTEPTEGRPVLVTYERDRVRGWDGASGAELWEDRGFRRREFLGGAATADGARHLLLIRWGARGRRTSGRRCGRGYHQSRKPISNKNRRGTGGWEIESLRSVSFLFSQGANGYLAVVDGATGQLLHELRPPYSQVFSSISEFAITGAACFHPTHAPGHTHIVTRCRDLPARLWDVDDEVLLHTLGSDNQSYMGSQVVSYRASPGGPDRILASGRGKVSVWDAASGELVRSFENEGKPALLTVFEGADGRARVAALAKDNAIGVWDPETGCREKVSDFPP